MSTMQGAKRQSIGKESGEYTLTTKPASKANEFEVTLHHGGRAVKAVTVVSISSRSAYFNDDPGRRSRKGSGS
jgi:hypothetical protein